MLEVTLYTTEKIYRDDLPDGESQGIIQSTSDDTVYITRIIVDDTSEAEGLLGEYEQSLSTIYDSSIREILED